MTEEQRYKESIQIEKDKVQLLKRIAVAIEAIACKEAPKEFIGGTLAHIGIDLCSCEDTTDGNSDNK